MLRAVAMAVALLLACPAYAGEGARSLVRGGVALELGSRLSLGPAVGWVGPQPGPQDRPGGGAGGFAMGGFARWSLDRYRLETTLLGSNGGGFGRVAGDLAAGYEGNLGGTSYQFRLGAAWGGAPMRFSVSPGWRSDLSADSDASRADLNLSLTVSHPITSSLSVTGVAAARHTLGEANAGRGFEDNQLLLGAGVGLQF